MNLLENIKMALWNVRANKVRSVLTMLGIVIGIAAVISILSVGDAMTAKVNDTLNSFGTTNIVAYVMPRQEDNSSIIFVTNSNMRLTDRSIRRLINKYSEKANLQKEVSPYTLRHSFCLYMLKNGMPKEYLAKLLDLKSIGLLDIYEDLCKKELRTVNKNI